MDHSEYREALDAYKQERLPVVLTAAEAAYQALVDASDPQPNPGPSPDSSDASEPSGDGGDTPVIPPTGVTLAAGAVVLLASSAAAAMAVRKRKK